MWVAQITDPEEQGEAEEQLAAFKKRFPAYDFALMGEEDSRFVIAVPNPRTIKFPSDEGTELEMLRFIVTELINELITGHLITDGQEMVAPPRAKH